MRDYRFGNFLRELRLRRGLTQYQLGALVCVSDKAVSKWENGASGPQSRMLYRLSEVLGVSVDELLSCKSRSSDERGKKGIFAMKKQLWDKVYEKLQTLYGGCVPIEMLNRFLSERTEMENSDMIVYLDMLAAIAEEAKKHGEHIRVNGGAGASFVAFVLGATEINPLEAHYHCPVCHKTVFDPRVADGWDLPARTCTCGADMLRDGHRIPFEIYRHVVWKYTGFDLSVSPEFMDRAKETVLSYFGRDNVVCLMRNGQPHVVTLVPVSEPADIMGGQTLSYEEYYEKLNHYPSVTLCAVEEIGAYRKLEMLTGTSFARIPFWQDEVLRAFADGNTDGIPEFGSAFIRGMLGEIRVTSFHEWIKIAGLSHGTGVWTDNARELVRQGMSVGNVIAYRDDVFLYLREKMLDMRLADMGFAYRIMEDTRRGIFARNGISEEIRRQLSAVGAEDWFTESIGKIRYLFPKAHGVLYVKTAAILMWYRLHYPTEFREAMLATK